MNIIDHECATFSLQAGGGFVPISPDKTPSNPNYTTTKGPHAFLQETHSFFLDSKGDKIEETIYYELFHPIPQHTKGVHLEKVRTTAEKVTLATGLLSSAATSIILAVGIKSHAAAEGSALIVSGTLTAGTTFFLNSNKAACIPGFFTVLLAMGSSAEDISERLVSLFVIASALSVGLAATCFTSNSLKK